jgi:hypothetical protein
MLHVLRNRCWLFVVIMSATISTSNSGASYGTTEDSGACCFPDGSCQVLPALDCQAGGGVYQGDGTNCVEANCPPPAPTGACCFIDDSCQILTAAECAAQSGAYYGDNWTCEDTDNCDVVQTCCFPDGLCADLTPPECQAQGGVSSGGSCFFTGCPAEFSGTVIHGGNGGIPESCIFDFSLLLCSVNQYIGNVRSDSLDLYQLVGQEVRLTGNRIRCLYSGGFFYDVTGAELVPCPTTATGSCSWGTVKRLFH